MSEFYAYLWLREDGTPYYAGKGKGNRAFVRGSHHLRPPSRDRILIFQRNSEVDAWATEKELIANWGRKDQGTGCLRNFTDGGDGVSGLQHTAISRKRMSEAKRGRPGHSLSADHIAAMAAGRIGKAHPHRKGYKMSVESRERIAKGHRGLKRSDESKQKMRVAAIARESRKRDANG